MDICAKALAFQMPQSECREDSRTTGLLSGWEDSGQQALPESSLPAEYLRMESIQTPSEILQKHTVSGVCW